MKNKYQKEYDTTKLFQNIWNCKRCKDKSLADPDTIGEPSIIGDKYGEKLRILFIAHNPIKYDKKKHNIGPFIDYSEYKKCSDEEANIQTWHASWLLKKYSKNLLETDDLSYIAFTNIVKCQRYKQKANNQPRKEMYNNCIDKYLMTEIDCLNPKIIIILGAPAIWYFYKKLFNRDVGNDVFDKVRKEKINGVRRIVLTSRHPANRAFSERDKTIKDNCKKIQRILDSI